MADEIYSMSNSHTASGQVDKSQHALFTNNLKATKAKAAGKLSSVVSRAAKELYLTWNFSKMVSLDYSQC